MTDGWLDGAALAAALGDDAAGAAGAFDPSEPGARHRLFRDGHGVACIAVVFPARRQTGIWLRPDLRGRGLARGWLAAALAAWPDRPLFAVIAPDHAASLALFARAGFRPLSRRPTPQGMRVLVLDAA